MKEPFVRARNRNGRCYELSYKVVTTYPDWLLVHGFVRMVPGSDEKIMPHAWTEKDDEVHDPVLNQSMEKRVFYDLYVVLDDELLRFSSRDAMIRLAKERKYGPWDENMEAWNGDHPFRLADYKCVK